MYYLAYSNIQHKVPPNFFSQKWVLQWLNYNCKILYRIDSRRRYTDTRHPTTELPDVSLEDPPDILVSKPPPVRRRYEWDWSVATRTFNPLCTTIFTHNALNVNSVLIYNLQQRLKVGRAMLHKTALSVSMYNTLKHCKLRNETDLWLPVQSIPYVQRFHTQCSKC